MACTNVIVINSIVNANKLAIIEQSRTFYHLWY